MFSNLFSPVDLGPIRLKNRIFVTPHATNFASDNRDNFPGDRLAHYCAERAKGGAGLIEISMVAVTPVTGFSSVLEAGTDAHFAPLFAGNPISLTGRWPINGLDSRVVPGYSKIAKMVHEHGAKCFVELGSAGTNDGNASGVSSYTWPSVTRIYAMPNFTPREMVSEEIGRIIEAYGKAAKFVKDSGLDGVDIHGTHGTLICEFLSKLLNRRKDKYGGSLDNRMRLLTEIIKQVREVAGDEIAVGMRLMGDEKFEGGNSPQDVAEIASHLDGKLNWITPDRGYYPQQDDWEVVPMYVEAGYNLPISSPIKSVLKKTKLGVVGRYVDPEFAERLISNGLADIVAMTRALIADPELPNKALEGRIEDIHPCIGGLQDCWGRMNRGLPISCTVNPVVGREQDWGKTGQAQIKKKILVIGGGPAGLEVARVAAERGHSVTIYEKSRLLGGQILLAAKLPGRVDLKSQINWQISQIRKLGVEVKFGAEVVPDPEVIEFVLNEEKPDAVVIATGSTPVVNGFQPYTFHEIDGANQSNVLSDIDVLANTIDLGQSILIGDTISFVEAPGIAEMLAKQGKEVEIVTYHSYVALELKLLNHWDHLLPRLISLGVKISPFTWIKKISGRKAILYNIFSEKIQREIEVDNVILITGRAQNDSLYLPFRSKLPQTYLVGDANLAGAKLGNAIYEAQKIARSF
ncbi:MAG: FAD-dependent oxidoreductase [Thaumarchaeota archaeon]|nr:FAD-dependent oxidoreductase [Nitrososphaerota archaeon]